VPNDEKLRYSLCLCDICNEAYFVSAQAQAQTSLRFWIQWVQVKGMLHNDGEGLKLGCGPI
jgi:hypothetical protein